MSAQPERHFKSRIREASRLAVELGLIPRKHRCEHCGASDKVERLQRHHPDYSRPLEVIWLCALCHGEMHRKRV